MAAFSRPAGVLSLLFAILFFVQATAALGHGHRSHEIKRHYEEAKKELERRQAQTGWHSGRYIQIEGVSPSSPAPRLEIRDMQRNTDAWNLYLLGMERFMGKSRTDKVGFYQIAAVHGRPYTTWNNFGPLVNTAGFCPHAQTLFGPWHRPYLALFEQALQMNIQEVIETFPAGQRARLRNIARDIRIPYFDWARNPEPGQPNVPTSIRDKTVTVTKPSGRVTINNPLYSYSWGSSLPAEMGGGPWNNFATTLRRPVGNPTRSNNNEMNARFGTLRVSLRDRVYNLFAARPAPPFGNVATSQIGARINGNVDSIESIHDVAHNTAGGETGGHLYYLDYSAFDPFFWLHHTNVDRLMAMYQATTPNSNIASARITRPMAQWNTGEMKNAYTPLKPFTKNSNGDYFTSMDAKWTKPFGYYYPETVNDSAQDVYNAVARLYGPTGARLSKRQSGYETSLPGQKQYQGRPYEEGEENYVLNVVANKYALPGSYSIHCFLSNPGDEDKYKTPVSNSTKPAYPIANGTAPAAPYPTGGAPTGNSTQPGYDNDDEADYNPAEDYTNDPNYVGNYGVLGMVHADTENPLYISGSLPLTTALQGKHADGHLASLCRADVEAYLKKHLHYVVVGPGNVEMPADAVPGLHLGVKACPVKPATNPGELPEMGDYVDIPSITEDMPAGKPYVHELDEMEKVYPGGDDMPTTPPVDDFPYPTLPEEEDGYCVVKETIKYVDADGNFLYEEMS